MANVETVLSHIGQGLKVFFTGAVKVATVLEPEVDILFPGISLLYNATVKAVADAETKAIAAGAQSGSGAQKLALVVSSISADFTAYATANNVVIDTASITAYATAIVASLNALQVKS